MKWLWFFILFSTNTAMASHWTFELGGTALGDYNVKDIDLEYKVGGFATSINYYSQPLGSLISSSVDFFWGAGFQYMSLSMERENLGSAPVTTSSEFDFTVYDLYLSGGLQWGDFIFEIPLSWIYAKETSGNNSGDIKYGFGYGLQVRYNIISNFFVKGSYQTTTFTKGKNSSTGQEGDLTYDVTLNTFNIMLGYAFSFGLSSF